VPDGGDEQAGVGRVNAGDGTTEVDGGACGEAGCQEDDATFASGAGRPPVLRVVTAAFQSMAAMGVPPLVPCWMNRLVKSSRLLTVREPSPRPRAS
jgi:hypothetical protein